MGLALSSSGSVSFDLGGVYTIDRIAFWNEDVTGIDSFTVTFSDDDITYGNDQMFSSDDLTDNPYKDAYKADILALSDFVVARYVHFQLNAHLPESGAGDHLTLPTVSIGEVAFSVAEPVPEPATILLFGVGVMGLLGSRRRK